MAGGPRRHLEEEWWLEWMGESPKEQFSLLVAFCTLVAIACYGVLGSCDLEMLVMCRDASVWLFRRVNLPFPEQGLSV